MCHRISIVCCSLIVCNLFRFGWMQSRIESWWLDMLYPLRSSVMTYYEYNCTSEELRLLNTPSFVPWTTTSSREWTNHSWQLVRYVLTVVKNPATVNDIDHWSFWIFQLIQRLTLMYVFWCLICRISLCITSAVARPCQQKYILHFSS